MHTLVLLPGMDGTGELFGPFLEALHPQFNVRVVRYPTDTALSYSELTAFARAALPTDEPFILLAESFSGPIGVSLAAEGTPGLIGLVLCCTFVRNPRPLFTSLRPFLGMVPVAAAPIGMLSSLLLGRYSSPALRSALVAALAQVSPAALRTRLRSVLSVDVSAQLAVVRVPVLYLRATHDRVVPAAASQLISRLKPDTRIVEIDAPHFLLQAAPAEAARQVETFAHDVRLIS